MRVLAFGRPSRQRGFSAMVEGLRFCGHSVQVMDGAGGEFSRLPPFDFAVMEGVRGYHKHIHKAFQSKDARPLLIAEYGYLKRASSELNDEANYWQLSLKTLGWAPVEECPSDRFDALGLDIKRPKVVSKTAPVIVCTDHPGVLDQYDDFKLSEVNYWAKSARDKIRKYTDRPVFLRTHPAQSIFIHGFDGWSRGDIDWSEQHACVTHNSNVGNEALINGCPVYTDGEAAYREISDPDLVSINQPWVPNVEVKRKFFARLAYAQWTLAEIRKGIPFTHYLEKGWLEL